MSPDDRFKIGSAGRKRGRETLRSRAAYPLFALAVLLASCEDDDPVAPPLPAARQPCFEMYVLNGDTCEPQLIVDPTCLTNDVPASGDLIRWDLDGDGEWDSDFHGVYSVRYRPEGFITGLWKARCELKDLAGRITSAEGSLDVTPLLPQAPDMKVRVFDFPSEPIVGVNYTILFFYRCWIDDRTTVSIRLTDGESPPVDRTIDCQPDLRCFPETWSLMFDKPGRHVVTLEIDPDNIFAEYDEFNNKASAVLFVESTDSRVAD